MAERALLAHEQNLGWKKLGLFPGQICLACWSTKSLDLEFELMVPC